MPHNTLRKEGINSANVAAQTKPALATGPRKRNQVALPHGGERGGITRMRQHAASHGNAMPTNAAQAANA